MSAEIFDPEVRYTGVTLGYQAGAALAGGTAPLIATMLMLNYGGSYIPVAIYFMITCVISLITINSVSGHKSQVESRSLA